MKELDYEFVGWLNDGKSDKIWGLIELLAPTSVARIQTKGVYLVFWGRRGKKYQTQFIRSHSRYHYLHSYNSLTYLKIQEKLSKGYKEVGKQMLSDIYPDFEKDLSSIAFWTMMTKSSEINPEEWQKIKEKIF